MKDEICIKESKEIYGHNECVMCTDEGIEFKDILVKFNEEWDDIESNICENHRDKLRDLANEHMARKLADEWEK